MDLNSGPWILLQIDLAILGKKILFNVLLGLSLMPQFKG